ncbi:MAG: hypothetical protein AAF410_02995 [Pseudomonadota bacterium]
MKKLMPIFFSFFIAMPVFAFNVDNIDSTSSVSLFDARSCNELYAEASALEKTSYADDYDHYNDSHAQVAGLASTIFAPAIYYFGYAAYKEMNSKKVAITARQDIDEIRQRMAEKRCFEIN